MFPAPRIAAPTRLAVFAFAFAALAACSTMNLPDAPRTVGPVAKPHYKLGAPYKIDGKWYAPAVDEDYDKVGVASWYGDAFHGKATANGEIFDKRRLSAAHKTLPLPTLVEVENLENRRRIVVRVNDRGPFVDDRIIDLSHAAADELGFAAKGLARVRVRYLSETGVNELAALPGDKAAALRVADAEPQRRRERRRGRKVEATPVAPAATDGETDLIGALIADTAGVTPPPARAAAPAEFWVEIAKIDDLNQLSKMRLDMPDLGPVSVQSDSQNGVMRQSLRVGPFRDEAIALASLTRAQAAGFGAARIVRGVGG